MHFVNEEFDTGPILAQRVVPVYPTDTPKKLAARVLKEVSLNHHVYPSTFFRTPNVSTKGASSVP